MPHEEGVNMDFNDYYFYGIDSIDIEKNMKYKHINSGICDIYNFDKALLNLEKILKNNSVLSKRLLNELITEENINWDGLDHISLLDYDLECVKKIQNKPSFTDASFYSLYVEPQLSFMFKKEKLEVIKPILYKRLPVYPDIIDEMHTLMMSDKERYSDLYDEVQVENQISLDKLEALTIPIEFILYSYYISYDKEDLIKHLKDIKELLKSYKIDIPIYDISTRAEIIDDESLDNAINSIKKRIKRIKK